MKSTTMNLMLATTALLVASTVASAQTTMKAEIPFAFQTAGKLMPSGTYLVTPASGESMFKLTDAKSGYSIMLTPQIPQDPKREWEASRGGVLQFGCRDGACKLKQIWTHSGAPAHAFAEPNSEKDKPVTLSVIRLAVGKQK